MFIFKDSLQLKNLLPLNWAFFPIALLGEMVFQTTPTSPGVLVFWVRPNSRFTQVNIHLHRCFETTKRRVQQFRFRVSRGLTPKMGRSRREPQKSPKKWTAPKFLLGVTYAINYRYIYINFREKMEGKESSWSFHRIQWDWYIYLHEGLIIQW